MRYLLQPIVEDAQGVKIPSVEFKVYPHAATLAAGAISQDLSGVWAVTEASLPAESILYSTPDVTDNSVIAGVMTSFADGSTVVAYLDEGNYVIVGKIGTKFFVNPLYRAGDVHDDAVGSTIPAGATGEQATAAMVAAIEAAGIAAAANTAAIAAAEDSNVTGVPISGAAPAAGTIPPEVDALGTTDSEEDDVARAFFDDFEVIYVHDGTDWVEMNRVSRGVTAAADPSTMTFKA